MTAARFDFRALAASARRDTADAELFELCDEWHALDAEERRLHDTWCEVDNGKPSDEELALNARTAELQKRIADTPAASIAGIIAKAMVADRGFLLDADGFLENPDDWPAASIIKDLLALARRSQP